MEKMKDEEAMLAAMFAANIVTNPWAGLGGFYSGYGQKSCSKNPPTKKQKKARAANERAKKARKRRR